MKKNFNELANEVLSAIGGKDNIQFLTHCVTRLRINPKDKSIVDTERIEKIKGVIGIQWQAEQLQIIIGQDVGRAYDAVCSIGGFQKEDALQENLDKKKKKFNLKNILSVFMETVSTIFAPFIPAIVGCGLMQGLLYSFSVFGWIDPNSMVYTFLYSCANTAFYFLPILVAFSSGKRFGCNPYVAAVLGAILIHPTFVGLAGKSMSLFGVPITFANYTSSVVPAMLTVYFMSWVEKGLKRIVPSMIDIIVVPFLSLIISAIVGFAFLAPLGSFLGSFIAGGIMRLYSSFGPLGGALYGISYPFILSTGMQVAFIPIILQNLATLGYDVLYPLNAASNAAMAAVAIYIFFKSKNEKIKSLGSSTGVTALIGVTEPVLFGLVLRYKKVLWAVMGGGALGGIVMGIFQVRYANFGFVPFGTIILALGPTFIYYLLGVGVAMVSAIAILHFLKWENEA
jgi:beta-glucoside PTS system EIICBA component